MKLNPCRRNYYLAIALLVIISVLIVIIVIAVANTDVVTREKIARQQLLKEPINLQGTILNEKGTPLSGASVSLRDKTGTTNRNGSFSGGIPISGAAILTPWKQPPGICCHLITKVPLSAFQTLNPVHARYSGTSGHFSRKLISAVST